MERRKKRSVTITVKLCGNTRTAGHRANLVRGLTFQRKSSIEITANSTLTCVEYQAEKNVALGDWRQNSVFMFERASSRWFLWVAKGFQPNFMRIHEISAGERQAPGPPKDGEGRGPSLEGMGESGDAVVVSTRRKRRKVNGKG